MKRLVQLSLLVSLSVACDEQPISQRNHVAVAIAPLSLPGLTDACYDLWVTDAADGGGTVVWRKDMVCASQFGNGQGDVAFVAPCDGAGQGGHTTGSINLTLVDLWASGDRTSATGLVAHDSYQNPCGTSDFRPSYASGSGAYNSDGFGVCQKTFECTANSDTKVSFNLTVLRDASQGFFDIAVTFEDLFCSAKLDCAAGDLLYAADGQRHDTAVLGFACTAGPAAPLVQTHLYMDDIVIRCDDTTVATLDPGVDDAADSGPGNRRAAGTVNDSDTDPLFQYAVYRGLESLGGSSFTKAYWNVAIGFDTSDLAGRVCRLTTRATASDEAFTNNSTPVGAVYPEVVFDVPLNGAGASALTCGKLALDAASNGPVRTRYTTQADCFDNHGFISANDLRTVDTSCLVCADGFHEDLGAPGHCCGGAGGACCDAGPACASGLTCATAVDTCGCGTGFACGTGCCATGQICGANGTCIAQPIGCISFDATSRDAGCPVGGCPATCLEILQANPSALSGIYTIDPDGPTGAAPIRARCDMVLDGGGWTLVAYEPQGLPTPANNAGALQFLANDTNNPTAIAETSAAGIIGTRFTWGSEYHSARLNWCNTNDSRNIFARFDTPADLFADTRKDTLASTLKLSNFFTNDSQLNSLVSTPADARFCRSATLSPLFRPGDTSWALKDDADNNFSCGCNSGGWHGVGTYYGGASPGTQSVCSAQGGGWAGSKGDAIAKGAVNINTLHFWIR